MGIRELAPNSGACLFRIGQQAALQLSFFVSFLTDISVVDFVWCLTALDWNRNRSIDETAEKLMELSVKAREEGKRYARSKPPAPLRRPFNEGEA